MKTKNHFSWRFLSDDVFDWACYVYKIIPQYNLHHKSAKPRRMISKISAIFPSIKVSLKKNYFHNSILFPVSMKNWHYVLIEKRYFGVHFLNKHSFIEFLAYFLYFSIHFLSKSLKRKENIKIAKENKAKVNQTFVYENWKNIKKLFKFFKYSYKKNDKTFVDKWERGS